MRVTHVIKSANLMGVERHLVLLLDSLRQAGVDADLVVLAPRTDGPPPVLELARHRGIATCVEPLDAYPSPVTLGRLTTHFKIRQPDVVHLHQWDAEAYGYLAARRAGVPHVVSSNYDTPQRPQSAGARWLRPHQWLRPRLWSRLDRLIVVNKFVYNKALSQGMNPEKLTLIPYGMTEEACGVGKGARDVLCAELGLDTGVSLVGMICPLDQLPGVNRAMEALWHLSAQRKNAHLLIVGDGPMRDTLERQARGYQIADRVHFLGWREDVHAVIAALDVLLLTCTAEDPTVLLLEAAALQTPVIAAAYDSVAGLIIEGETGFLISATGEMDHMTSGLWLLLDDPDMRRQMGARFHDTVATRFRFDPVVRSTLDVYEGLLA